MQAAAFPALMRREVVEARTGLSRSVLYRLIAAGEFPKPIELCGRSRVWVESDVNAWVAAKIEASRSKEAAR